MVKFAMKQSLQIKPQLSATARMQIAFDLLAAPAAKLEALLCHTLEDNPLLDVELTLGEADSCKKDSSIVEELDFTKDTYEKVEAINEDFDDLFWQSFSPLERREGPQDSSQDGSIYNPSFSMAQLPYLPGSDETLAKRLLEVSDDHRMREEALWLAACCNSQGLLDEPLEELSKKAPPSLQPLTVQRLKAAQLLLQSLEPKGLASFTLQQALLFQLEQKQLSQSKAYLVVKEHWSWLLKYPNRLAKRLHLSATEVKNEIFEPLKKLHTHWPRHLTDTNYDHEIDLHFNWEGEAWHITIEKPFTEQLKLNQSNIEALQKGDREAKSYLNKKMAQCRWVLQALRHREENLLSVAYTIANLQEAYLRGIGPLKPLHLKELSSCCNLHLSTIARVLQEKIIAAPCGVIAFRDLLSYGQKNSEGVAVSNAQIAEKICQWIRQENPLMPLSDEALSSKLNQEGIMCARRTVAKYRHLQGIANSSMRRKS